MTESTLLQTTENNNTTTTKMDRAVSPSPSEQQYALKWNDFQSSILSSFRHLRDEEDFVDVTLACDIRSFTAHKVVLSACSPYFRKLLKANPCEHPIIILRDIRAEDVESLLRFMYNGEVHIGHEQLSDFLKTAQLLQVRGLADVTGPQSKGLPLSTSLIPETNTSSTANINDVHSLRSGMMGSSLPNPLSGVNTSKLQETKASPTSTSLPWELSDDRRKSHLTPPPPQKRIKSVDLYRAQHGINPEVDPNALKDVQPLLAAAAAYRGRERNRSKENINRSRDSSSQDLSKTELRDSLLGQALESSASAKKHPDLASLQAQSTGEDSNSSDHSAASDTGDYDDTMNGSMDQRFSSFLGLQGIPGLLPGPSGMNDSFVSRRQLEMRVRATDPRPCPKCGKIYRSAHTLRTHLEDKHTVCPGYRCVLCGTVAKSRNSLHSHMSRQHRGISTKDLPVLPMPSPFDPELASRLLAKAGVKISPAELRARASPTSGTRRGDMKMESSRGMHDTDSNIDEMEDPEDLTMASGINNNNMSGRYDSMMGFTHPNTTITRVGSAGGKSDNQDQKDLPHGATGSSILDTYLQFISESAFGMGMSQEQTAAAIHAAKMAQLSTLGHNFDKLPPSLLPPHLDLSKLNRQSPDINRMQSGGGVTIEPTKIPTSYANSGRDSADIRRDDSQPMDLGADDHRMQVKDRNCRRDSDNNGASNNANSSGEDEYGSDDDGDREKN
ncbi:protein abrupt isoform X2 [Sitodiplosis mosellana]|uniref:protein abrupt isoform X2 n=1 Tax=Sitodiplosis mosellana TaxID=263140 RepID=UPI002443E48C|nr:protein abrupt isoform X2 [Sitodiplosis mosellana]XP_055299358.1 protein abrupt isoform X2 [Sitodiplosis mosellana]XP_055299359.1 protein abrupt isoform X2 [Sitodiplosis mosellana]XP_055299360.1 protein abrupt isoform X2 [Sitodiplosis mosellana]XP_055299361.1 protein abrupt isoform X2 [Sitodiplosis mosellana]